MLLDKDRLHALGLQHQPSWATGNLLRDMQGPPKMARAEAHAKHDGKHREPGGDGVCLRRSPSGASPWCWSDPHWPSCCRRTCFTPVLWLALALTGTAGVFLLLDAEFLAAVQLLLYAGGIITIVVFAIVVTERLVGERLSQTSRRYHGRRCVALALLVARRQCDRQPSAGHGERTPLTAGLTRPIGESVLTTFVLPFELLGVLMLAAMLGAMYFARPED